MHPCVKRRSSQYLLNSGLSSEASDPEQPEPVVAAGAVHVQLPLLHRRRLNHDGPPHLLATSLRWGKSQNEVF